MGAQLTVTVIRTAMFATRVILPDVLTTDDSILQAFHVRDLAIAPASLSFFLIHLPLLQASHCKILP